MADRPTFDDSVEAGHELRDVSIRRVVLAGVALVILVIFAIIAMRVLFGTLFDRTVRLSGPTHPMAEGEQPPPPAPRLQVAPADDLKQLRAFEEERLSRYRWVDEEAGIAQIPIDRAMELVAERQALAGEKRETPPAPQPEPEPAAAHPEPEHKTHSEQDVP